MTRGSWTRHRIVSYSRAGCLLHTSDVLTTVCGIAHASRPVPITMIFILWVRLHLVQLLRTESGEKLSCKCTSANPISTAPANCSADGAVGFLSVHPDVRDQTLKLLCSRSRSRKFPIRQIGCMRAGCRTSGWMGQSSLPHKVFQKSEPSGSMPSIWECGAWGSRRRRVPSRLIACGSLLFDMVSGFRENSLVLLAS